MHHSKKPAVAVLLCTHQGQRFLKAQLDSIYAQDYDNIRVWVSDDGSDDGTMALLLQHQHIWGQENFHIVSGPRKNHVNNFLRLTYSADINAKFFAYADQDDIWETNKISRALLKLASISSDFPSLYCSRTRLIDEQDRAIGFSPLFQKPPSFANALVQNIGGGNTMIMNAKARALLCMAKIDRPVVNHDWWAYLIITGAEGKIFYDAYPSVRYRQHGGNLIGANIGWYARFTRLKLLLKGRFRNWNQTNIQALQRVRPLLSAQNQRVLDDFCAARDEKFLMRLHHLWRSGVYRQTWMGNLGLIAAVILKKL